MASVKHIDRNPEFVFEFTKDVEASVMDMLNTHYLTEVLDGSREYLPNNKIRVTIIVEDELRASQLSEALKMWRVKFYGLNAINRN